MATSIITPGDTFKVGTFAELDFRYRSWKHYGHDLGFSCAFRQWRAHDSHCRFLHGYSLAFTLNFECASLDDRNWCVDFGGLKSVKSILEDNFDHRTIVAEDDPELETFKELHAKGLIQLVTMPAVGCEKFAEFVYEVVQQWLLDYGYGARIRMRSVEVREHGANGAEYIPLQPPTMTVTA